MSILSPDVDKKEVLQLLRATRELLSTQDRWCRGSPARNRDGEPTGVFDSDAFSFCLTGALEFMQDQLELPGDTRHAARDVLYDQILSPISSFNDSHSHPHILSLLDSGIERLSQPFDATPPS